MVGRYRLHLENNRLIYDFTFERHINILNGDSSSGKSEFVNLLQTSLREISGSGRAVADYQTDFDWVVVLTPEDRSVELIKARIGEENIGKSGLIVSDEDTLFFLKEWAIKDMLQNLDCYVLLVTRNKKGVGSLPYSVKSVYEMVTVGTNEEKVRVALVNRYVNKLTDNINVDMLVSEDSGSGYQFYNKTLRVYVDTLSSKDKLNQYFRKNLKRLERYTNVVLVVDGAGFGYNMYKANEIRKGLLKHNISLTIVIPESFEWLILRSRLLKQYSSCIVEVYDKADSRKYISWEDYFTRVLRRVMKQEYNLVYDKKKGDDEVIAKLIELQDGVYDYLEGDEVEIIYYD